MAQSRCPISVTQVCKGENYITIEWSTNNGVKQAMKDHLVMSATGHSHSHYLLSSQQLCLIMPYASFFELVSQPANKEKHNCHFLLIRTRNSLWNVPDLSQHFKQPGSVSVCEQLVPCVILNVRLASSSPPLSFSSSSAWRWQWCRRWIVRRHKWAVPAKNLQRRRQISLSRAQQASLIITCSSSVPFIMSQTVTKQDHFMQLPKTLSFVTNIRVTLNESPMQ